MGRLQPISAIFTEAICIQLSETNPDIECKTIYRNDNAWEQLKSGGESVTDVIKRVMI